MKYLRSFWNSHKSTDDTGFVTIEFIAGIAFLLLPVALLVMTFSTWEEQQSMARTAAREAARTYVLTLDENQTKDVVAQIASNYHLDPNDVTLQLSGNAADRGGSVKATVTVKVPETDIGLLHINTSGLTVSESHTEVRDLYRSAPQ